jgi:hypothetical protein
LVRVYHRIDKEDSRKIHRMVQAWAGTDVEVLVIDITKMEVQIDKRRTD